MILNIKCPSCKSPNVYFDMYCDEAMFGQIDLVHFMRCDDCGNISSPRETRKEVIEDWKEDGE